MPPQVFVSYVREDSPLVDRLAADLRREGVEVWLDREHIAPGERWRDAIRRGIFRGDLFIACFSSSYAQRDKTYMNEELVLAIEQLRMRPTDRSWFIPVSLDGSAIPPRAIGGGETLHDLQAVDLSNAWQTGVRRILAVVQPSPGITGNATRKFPHESTADKALRVDRERRAAEQAKKFVWSPASVTAALTEVNNLYITLVAHANELSVLTSSLNIEAEKSFPSCVVRLGDHSILVCWQQPYMNEVEDARLSVLEYAFRYSFSFPAQSKEYTIRKEYQFTVNDGQHGWSSGGEFVTTNDVVDVCFEFLLARVELHR